MVDEARSDASQGSSQFEEKNHMEAQIQCALDRAQRFLNYRPRSEYEITSRLRRQGFTDEVIEATLRKLRHLKLVDDASFAEFWKENRQTFRPRSKQLLRHELRQKGVGKDLIATITQGVDDEDEAYRAGYRKAHSLRWTDYYEFRRKLGAFLSRRGFNYDVINSVVERVWKEIESEGENE